jgi:outer membrane protein assembly factor BamE (lipoprotein component of BamABCDE complex)
MKKAIAAAFITAGLLTGCTAQDHARDVNAAQQGDRVTAGTVQREIRVGMSGGEVAQVLGSPNIVTTDEYRREVWVYDKISTTHVYSQSSGGVSALFFGAGFGNPLLAGTASGNAQYGTGAASTSQRTFTVVIKFNEGGAVRDFAYHTTTF